MEIKSRIFFVNEKLRKYFEELKQGKTEEQELYYQLKQAFESLKNNAYSGIQVPKKLIPKEYEERFGNLVNLWKYNLPNAWRLAYTVKNDKVNILSIILEWMDHKEYERRFKY